MCWIDDKNKGINPVGRPPKPEEARRHSCHYSVSYNTKMYMLSRTDAYGKEVKPGVYLDKLVEADKTRLGFDLDFEE